MIYAGKNSKNIIASVLGVLLFPENGKSKYLTGKGVLNLVVSQCVHIMKKSRIAEKDIKILFLLHGQY
jgi:hypothetical protein